MSPTQLRTNPNTRFTICMLHVSDEKGRLIKCPKTYNFLPKTCLCILVIKWHGMHTFFIH